MLTQFYKFINKFKLQGYHGWECSIETKGIKREDNKTPSKDKTYRESANP